MKPILSNERGMALAVAIFALVVVGALVAGAFFAGTQEQRVGENSRRLTQSFGAAEYALSQVIRKWDPQIINRVRQYPLDSVAVPLAPQNLADTLTPDGTGLYSGYVYRLNGHEYLVDITARDRKSAGGIIGGGARQRLGELVRVRPLNLNINAALTTQGSVSLAGNATVNGRDTIPQGWNTTYCDTSHDTTKAGIRLPSATNVTTSGNGTILGNPPVRGDTSIHPNTFTQFGDVSYAAMAAAATIQLAGGNYQTQPNLNGNGQCNKLTAMNWGDGMNPSQPCGNYFPIVHIAGTATLNGVQGQGVLLVDGDLNIQGSFIYYGVVIVQGAIKSAGGGTTDAHFYGALMAKDVALSTQSLAGNATLQYSKCAITNAMQGTMIVTPSRSRAWSQLY
jgi:hypothetical protein